jgi:hypothetical protein
MLGRPYYRRTRYLRQNCCRRPVARLLWFPLVRAVKAKGEVVYRLVRGWQRVARQSRAVAAHLRFRLPWLRRAVAARVRGEGSLSLPKLWQAVDRHLLGAAVRLRLPRLLFPEGVGKVGGAARYRLPRPLRRVLVGSRGVRGLSRFPWRSRAVAAR